MMLSLDSTFSVGMSCFSDDLVLKASCIKDSTSLSQWNETIFNKTVVDKSTSIYRFAYIVFWRENRLYDEKFNETNDLIIIHYYLFSSCLL